MRVLVPNLGSTSLKYQLIDMDGEKVLARGKIDRIGSGQAETTFSDSTGKTNRKMVAIPDHRSAIQMLITELNQLHFKGQQGSPVDVVGFKAVHGGARYQGTFPVTSDMLDAMRELIPSFPVHNPVYIQAMEIFQELLPDVPMIAAFETGFHITIPEEACLYGVPYEWVEKYDMRRFGFHGATHRYVSERAAEMLGHSLAGLRMIACHLGGGASVCGIKDGKSVEFGGGFSGQSGLEGATRVGEFDAFGMTYLMEGKTFRHRRFGSYCVQKAGCWESPA
jgi:acetate kinase